MENETKADLAAPAQIVTHEEVRSVTPQVDIESLVEARVREAEAKRSAFARDVRNECKRHGLSDHAEDLIESCKDTSEANRKILDLVATRQTKVMPVITFGANGIDKQTDAMKIGLQSRALTTKQFAKLNPDADKTPGWQDFKHATLLDIGRACLEMGGVNTRGMAPHMIANAALGFDYRTRAVGDVAYNTTGTFVNILLDAANKNVLDAYVECNTTWQQVARQGQSAKDYKSLNRIRLSGIGNLDMWPENTIPTQQKLSDKKESYKVERYADQLSIDQMVIINDDMDCLSRIPAMQGAAAARSVNASWWNAIFANDALQVDSVAFFNSAHNNLLASGAAPTTAQLNTMRATMRKQTGMAGEPISPTPRVLAVPAALESTAKQLLRSEYDNTASVFQAWNPNSDLIPVCEPLLDGNSATAYYLFATGNEACGEVTFLQGYEQPFVSTTVSPETLSYKILVTQSWGVKLLDFQYAVKNPGA